MRRSVIETIMGAVVLVVAGLFLFFAYSSSNVRATDGYELIARFNKVDGLANGSDVRLSGIKVGSVIGQNLDPKTYRAVVRISVDSALKLPEDTTARIQSDGLLGTAYMVLDPGGSEEMLQPGGQIHYTQDAINLVDLLGRFIFSGGGSGGVTGGGGTGGGGSSTPQPPAPPAAQDGGESTTPSLLQ